MSRVQCISLISLISLKANRKTPNVYNYYNYFLFLTIHYHQVAINYQLLFLFICDNKMSSVSQSGSFWYFQA